MDFTKLGNYEKVRGYCVEARIMLENYQHENFRLRIFASEKEARDFIQESFFKENKKAQYDESLFEKRLNNLEAGFYEIDFSNVFKKRLDFLEVFIRIRDFFKDDENTLSLAKGRNFDELVRV